MINITVTVDNLVDVLRVFSKIQLLRYNGSSIPSTPINVSDYSVIATGIDQLNNRNNVSDIVLTSSLTRYYFVDPDGSKDSWYISRYTNSDNSSSSGWSDPLQGELTNFYYNPLYPTEVDYGTSDKQVISRIRLLTGDPVGLSRTYGLDAEAGLHTDNQVFEWEDRGWPCSVNMYGIQYTSSANPTVNGYTYLRFNEPLNTTPTTISGIEHAIDIWYYTFRRSDKEIMDVFDDTYPPTPLNTTNCTQDIYMLQASYDLLNSETWTAVAENGAIITDNKDTYNPSPGLNMRDKMLSKLKDRLDAAIKALRLSGVAGVRLD